MELYFFGEKAGAMKSLTASIMLFLHLIEASMFIYTDTCPMTGLTIGLLFRNDYITQKQIS